MNTGNNTSCIHVVFDAYDKSPSSMSSFFRFGISVWSPDAGNGRSRCSRLQSSVSTAAWRRVEIASAEGVMAGKRAVFEVAHAGSEWNSTPGRAARTGLLTRAHTVPRSTSAILRGSATSITPATAPVRMRQTFLTPLQVDRSLVSPATGVGSEDYGFRSKRSERLQTVQRQ